MAGAGRKRIVTIGGGTGTFVVLSGLKRIPGVTLAAVVSVADSGGATGRLRDAYGFLPLGDARQALIALSENGDSSLIRRLFEYRFSKGDVTGHNFGNLFLTALTDMLGSDADAIEAASRILRVTGRVIPVSKEPVTLVARLADGATIVGEHEIDARVPGRPCIASLSARDAVAGSAEACGAIQDADLVILGPGDLYTSTLANFTVSGLRRCVSGTQAKLVYIMNLFTKAGQTEGYGAARHLGEVTRYAGRKPDVVIVNTTPFSREVLALYEKEHEFPVVDDLPRDPSVIRGSFADVVVAKPIPGDAAPRSFIRHSSEKIAAAIQTLLSQ